MNHMPSNIRPAEFARMVYAHTVAEGNDFEKDVLNEKYWCHLSKTLKVGDLVEVTAHDASYFAVLYVVAVYNVAIKVVCLNHKSLSVNVDEQDENREYKVQHRRNRLWCIVRLSDDAVIKDQIQTKEDAYLELSGYMKALAA